jgi:hypothetical protein
MRATVLGMLLVPSLATRSGALSGIEQVTPLEEQWETFLVISSVHPSGRPLGKATVPLWVNSLEKWMELL